MLIKEDGEFATGPYEGRDLDEVADLDPGYLEDVLDNEDLGVDEVDLIEEALERRDSEDDSDIDE